MTTESGSGGGISVWVWVAIAAGVLLLILGSFAVFGVGGDDEAATTTVTDAPTTSTSEGETTTTEAETTTTEGETTTTTTPPTDVAETPVTAVLQPYNDGGAVLFPPGSVEAHWYQWDGQYILLYRGYDAEERLAICPGNSIETSPANWEFVSNSPFLLPADEICVDVPKLADPANGVRECGSLMYYITEIPTTAEGNLFGPSSRTTATASRARPAASPLISPTRRSSSRNKARIRWHRATSMMVASSSVPPER